MTTPATTPPPAQSLCPSWQDIHRLSRALADRLSTQGPWRAIIAVARGGLVPTTIIARELGVRMVDTVCIATHGDDGSTHPLRILKVLPGNGEGCLVVDDLVDTGRTYESVRSYLPKAHYVALYAKPGGKEQVDTWGVEVNQDVWVHFPWERLPES